MMAGDVAKCIERAAEAACDYAALCLENTFPDMFPYPSYARWSNQPDGAREMWRRQALVTVVAYLVGRAGADAALYDEIQIILNSVDRRWPETLQKVAVNVGAVKAPGRAFGGDLREPVTALSLFRWDVGVSGSLLVEAYRKEELRRLSEKALLLRNGALSEQDEASDRAWSKRNERLLADAEARIALSEEAGRSLSVAENAKPAQPDSKALSSITGGR